MTGGPLLCSVFVPKHGIPGRPAFLHAVAKREQPRNDLRHQNRRGQLLLLARGLPATAGRLRRFASLAGAVWQKIRPEAPFNFIARPEWEARNLMLRLAAIAAALVLALGADAEPPPEEPRFDAMNELRKRPAPALSELSPEERQAVDTAVDQKKCIAATKLLIRAYLRRYQDMQPLTREHDYEVSWWLFAGRTAYPETFVCFATERLRRHAEQYLDVKFDDYSWCGEISTQWPDSLRQSHARALHGSLYLLAMMADNENLVAMRELLKANRDYWFIQLDDIAHYAILAHIAQQDTLTAEEEGERTALAARLTQEARDHAEWSFGYTIAMQAFGTCGDGAE